MKEFIIKCKAKNLIEEIRKEAEKEKTEIQKEYEIFLDDLNLKDTPKNKQKFKNDFVQWYIELFGMNDERTKNIIEELKEL